MATNTTKAVKEIIILERSIEELRRSFDHISNIYDQLRLKALGLLAGEVTIVTFIFFDEKSRTLPVGADRIIFFYFALACLSMSFGFLLWILSTVAWTLPHDQKDAATTLTDKNRKTELDFIRYLHDDYCLAVSKNNKIVSVKAKKFNWCVNMLSAGVIILLVIKFAGGLKI